MNPFDNPLVAALLGTAAPTVIIQADAPCFTIAHYNNAYQDAVYLNNRNVRGMSFWEAFDPKKSGGRGSTALLEGFHEAIYKREIVQTPALQYDVLTYIHNVWETNWWEVKIIPVVYGDDVKYLLLNIYNVTNKVLYQDAIEQAIMKELTLAEDLAATNVKLNIAVRKLADSHAELTKTKAALESLNQQLQRKVFERSIKLFASDAKHRTLIDNAPVAIAVLKGPNHIVETANKQIIKYWGKTDSVINKPLAVALPELEGQPFIEILNNVRKSGTPYVNPELCAYLYIDSVYQPRYYDMIYQPIEHTEGADSIFIVAFDITDHVKARKKLEESESMLQIAATAANIGIWSFNPNGNVMSYNPVFAKILGWDSDELMTFEQAVGYITDQYRPKVMAVVKEATEHGGEYDFTYSHYRFNDRKVIFLRLIGKTTFDHTGENKIFSGIIMEVTADHNLAGI